MTTFASIEDGKLIAPLLPEVYGVETNGYVPPTGWTTLLARHDIVSGLRVVTLRNTVAGSVNYGRIVTVFAGLELPGLSSPPSPTLSAAADIFFNKLPEAYWTAVKGYLEEVLGLIRSQYQGSRWLLAGHSLGGWDAQMGTAYVLDRFAPNDPLSVGFATVTGNTIGAAATLGAAGLGQYAQDVAERTLNFVVAGDRVHTLTPQLGEVFQMGELSVWQKFGFWIMDHLIPTRIDDLIYSLITAKIYHAPEVARDRILALPSLPNWEPVAQDASRFTGENAASLKEGALALQTRQEIPVFDLVNPIPLQSAGEAYGLTLGANGQPATLVRVSVDQQGGGGGGGGIDWGREGYLLGVDALGHSALAAKPGALDGVKAEADGAVELDLRTIPESDVRAVDWNADGGGRLEAQGGVLGAPGDFIAFFPPADQLIEADQFIQIGTTVAETLTGFEGRDVIIAGAGDDTISVGAGDDWVYADAGNDTVIGGEGNDWLYGGTGNNLLEGGEGDDKLLGGPGSDVMYGGDGGDLLNTGSGGEDWLYGGPGDDAYMVAPPGIVHIRDDGRVDDLCYPDETFQCGDRLTFGPSVTPNDTDVTWSGRNVILRFGGGGGGTVWIEDGLAAWDDDDDEHVIEYVEFADGTVWPWVEVIKDAEPLPPGDPLGDSGPPPEIWPFLLRDLLHGGALQGATALDDIVNIFDDAEVIVSPIVLDLDGDGVETRDVNAGAHFDHGGEGFRERTGWMGGDDGLLVWDRNGDGQVNRGSELFGNRTLLPDGVTPAANGFAALAAWDANGDGKIDASDPIWANLKIWHDADSDGASTPGELATPADLGITAINTGYTTSSIVDAQGNAHKQIGTFTKADGSTAAAEDVWFKVDTVHSVAPDPVPVPADVAALPSLPGYGTVFSLRQAMARDTSGTLKGLVAAFIAEANPTQREVLVDQILFRWTGADTVDPTSRGPFMDARQVAVLEAFMGQGYVGSDGTTNPHHQSGPLLWEAYRQLREWTYVQLDVQTHLADLYRLIDFSWDEQRGLVGDLAPVQAELQARLIADPVAGRQDLTEFARSIQGLKAEDMLGFWVFRDAFAAQDPSLGWGIDVGGRNLIVGTAASEGLVGTSDPDAIQGGGGDDTLWGNQGADVLYGDAGRDILYGGPGDDLLVGGDDVDQLYGEAGQNRLEGGAGDDWINGGNDAEVLIGGTGDDYMWGNGGDDTLLGGPGRDSIWGGDGADILDGEGGGGVDFLAGGAGPDLYRFGRGSGAVVIRDDDSTPGVIDTIQLGAGILPGDVSARRQGDDLVLTVNGTIDVIDVQYFFLSDAPGNQIERILFEDGTVWDVATLRQLVLQGTSGPDTLIGYSGPDTLSGLDGNDQIYGRDGDDSLDGGPGNDSLWGEAGNDTLLGGPGDDQLRGGDGADTIDGGGGNNYVEGGPGGDTYLFGRGSGALSIRENDATAGVIDTIRIGAGVLPSDVTVQRSADHLSIRINDTGDSLGVFYFFDETTTANQVEQIRFVDGTVWDVPYLWQRVLTGSEGADTLVGYRTDDSLHGLGGNDWMYGRDGNDTLDGAAGNDYLWGEGGNDTLLGGLGDDTLYGGDGADTIEGGGGVNYTEGGPGGDTYLFGRGSGTLTIRDPDTTAGVIDTIQLGPGVLPTDVTIWRNGDHLNLKINDTGDTLGVLYFFYQDLPDNQIEQIRFENGTIWDLATIKQMVLMGSAAADTLIGYATADTLQGLAGNDTLWGRAGNDRLDGGLGADTMYGEAGNDAYVVESTGDVVVESVGNGTDTVESAITYTLPAEVENLTLTGTAAINGTGNGLDNILTGNSATNVLTGGAGNDTYVVGAGDTVVEIAGQGTDTVQSSITYTLGANVENLVLTGSAAINGTGNTLNNSLTGNAAANSLNGGTGADSMAGGAGNDTYVVENAGDVVTENANEGTDTVQSSITYTLPAYVENLTLTGAVAINATGNALANTLTGNSAANILTGGLGNDTYVIGAGDTVVENANEGTDTVQSSITYTLGANVENLVLTGTSAINGMGNTLNNSLTGNSAANTLNGGAGADTMAGGAGNDIYAVDSVGDVVTELASQGTDTVQASITYTLPANVENLTLTGTAAISGTGNALANVLTGNTAANVLTGGTGNDTYVVDNAGDVVVENLNEGTDTVQSSITYTLPGNVENLTLTGVAAINATGNALANTLTGNSAANVLTGGAGNDTYVVGAGDTVVENPGGGTDTIQSAVTYTLDANVENLTLTGTAAINGTGNDLNNSLTGNTAANVLNGGAGNDTLTGGTGNDSYVLNPGWGQDTIVENDATVGNTDTALFGAPVRTLDLVLSRTGNNLALALHGTTDKVTEQSWYLGTTYQTEVIQAGDGSRLLSTQVDLLIQAMASYTATTGLTWDQAIDQRPQEVESVLAGYWQHP
jgi:Ca2+-binding RTX toxin-like protein